MNELEAEFTESERLWRNYHAMNRSNREWKFALLMLIAVAVLTFFHFFVLSVILANV